MIELLNTKRPDPRLLSLLKPRAAGSEHIQRLRLSVENIPHASRGSVIAVTSPAYSDDQIVTSINLAGALALAAGRKVLLITLQLRYADRSVFKLLGITRTASDATDYHLPHYNLYLMVLGHRHDSAYEYLSADSFSELLLSARRDYDYVILDTSPVNQYPDSQIISRWVDGFIVLVLAGQTTRKQLEECLNLMSPEKVHGLVMVDNRAS